MPSQLSEILDRHEADLLTEWVQLQNRETAIRSKVPLDVLTRQSREFVAGLRDGLQRDDTGDIASAAWTRVRDVLSAISRDRAERGLSARDTATFVFSFKQPLFQHLRQAYRQDGEALAAGTWTATLLLDSLGLFTTEVYQKAREEVISRQQQELLELSTPVVRLWDQVLALPLIGTLDSARTQIVMQNLLEAIVQTGAAIAIIDITGVPTVDTLVAQHLLKTVAAARLMGADCIISGIRPQIAQTIIHLGVELSDVTTKANLADAFQVALRRIGLSIVKVEKA